MICSQHKTNQVYDSITDQTQLIKTIGANVDLGLDGVDRMERSFTQWSVKVLNAMHDSLAGSPQIPTEGKPPRPLASRKSMVHLSYYVLPHSC